MFPDRGQDPVATPLPSPVPLRVLSICLGEEPASLFLYGDQSASARIIRQAIYDWTVFDDQEQASALLERVPSQENGQVIFTEVDVLPGERIVDGNGNLAVLSAGTQYRPSGCFDSSCLETYSDQPSILMDQVQVEFSMRPGINWSDGTEVTPADSIYSYQTALAIYGSGGPLKLRYSSSYQAGEDGEIYWKGLPGYFGILSYGDLFFDPLPEHLWKNLSREELLTSAQTSTRPLAWGLYQVVDWVFGDHITLVPNRQGYLAGENVSAFDALVFRFVSTAEEALAAFEAGECQLVANQAGLDEFLVEIRQSAAENELLIYHSEDKAWEQMSFGIQPSGSKLNLLADPALRRAMAGCIDRDRIATARLDAVESADDIYPPDPSRISDLEPSVIYQPAESRQMLKEQGWIDDDGNPETPRLASGIEGIPDGTKLEFTLLAAEADRLPLAVREIQDGLVSCGVGLEVEMLPAQELLAPGPEGPIFGREFDLAYFAWAAGRYQPCRLFISDEIPGLYPAFLKGWGGVNAPGYSNQDFDLLCQDLLTSLPDSEGYDDTETGIRTLFRADLPALPLLFRREVIIAAVELTGLESDHFPLLWNIEAIQ